MTATTCIAYNADGFICHRPAPYLDAQRGGYVCEEHVPYLVESPHVHGRYLVAGYELTSGDRIALDLGGQVLNGRVEFDTDLQRYVAWVGAAAIPLRAGLLAHRSGG